MWLKYSILIIIFLVFISPITYATFDLDFYLDNLTVEFDGLSHFDDWEALDNFINFSNVSMSSGYNLTTIISLESNGTINITIYNLTPREWLNFTTMNYSEGVVANITLGVWGANEEILEYRDSVFQQLLNANGTGYYTIEDWNFSSKQNFEFKTPPYKADLSLENDYNSSIASINFNWTCSDYSTNMTTNLSIDGSVNQSDVLTNNNTFTNYTVIVEEGNHNWTIQCIDSAVNANTSTTYNFTIDLTPPNSITASTSPSSVVERGNITISANVTDVLLNPDTTIAEVENPNNAKINFTMTKLTTASFEVNISGVNTDVIGNYSVDFYANDTVGNMNYTDYNLTFEIIEIAGVPSGGGGGGGWVSPPTTTPPPLPLPSNISEEFLKFLNITKPNMTFFFVTDDKKSTLYCRVNIYGFENITVGNFTFIDCIKHYFQPGKIIFFGFGSYSPFGYILEKDYILNITDINTGIETIIKGKPLSSEWYAKSGTYLVTASITDSEGISFNASKMFTVIKPYLPANATEQDNRVEWIPDVVAPWASNVFDGIKQLLGSKFDVVIAKLRGIWRFLWKV